MEIRILSPTSLALFLKAINRSYGAPSSDPVFPAIILYYFVCETWWRRLRRNRGKKKISKGLDPGYSSPASENLHGFSEVGSRPWLKSDPI